MLSRYRQECVGISVKLFFRICRMHKRDHRKHHPLVTGGKVVQKFLALFSLLLHVIRNDSGKVIVGVLPALPVRDICLHAQ